jgi:hypothetical protein
MGESALKSTGLVVPLDGVMMPVVRAIGTVPPPTEDVFKVVNKDTGEVFDIRELDEKPVDSFNSFHHVRSSSLESISVCVNPLI